MHLLLWELIVTVEHMLPNAELIHLGYKKHDAEMVSLLACLSLSPIFCKSSKCLRGSGEFSRSLMISAARFGPIPWHHAKDKF
jgi:hypothetical protein